MLRITKNLALPLGLTLLLICHPWGISSAEAQSCRHIGSTQQQAGSRLSVGSQVDGDLVTICANKKLIQALTQTIAPKPLPAKPSSKPSSKPIVKPKPAPVFSPKQPAHQPPAKPKPKVRTKTRTSANSSTAVFKALKPVAWISPGNSVKPDQVANFAVEFTQSFGSAKLLGNPVVVRFRPESAAWDFGDSATALGSKSSHSYATSGNYLALAHVRYRVDYRLASGSWLRDPDPVVLASMPINVSVGQNLGSQSSGSTVLITPP